MIVLNYIYNLQGFISKEAFSGILLFFATLLAVIIANSPLAQSYYDVWHTPLGVTLGSHEISMTLTYWIDDGLMALFFLMVGLEIKREMLLGGLSSIQKASFPLVAALGGMAIPALLYVALNPTNPLGFGIPMATDIAFALGILMLLGKRVNPALKLFLVALAVVDDLGAVMVVATVYTNALHLEYLMHVILIYGAIWILNLRGVKLLTPYLILGIALWVYIHAIGIHATIAGVLLAFAIPISSRIDERRFIDESHKALQTFEKHCDPIPMLNNTQVHALEQIAYGYARVQNPLVKLEHNLHNLSAFFIMPLFAFSNAGVAIELSSVSQHLMVVLGVVVGLIIGKPLGIFGFTYLAHKLGWVTKPNNLSWQEILAVGFIGGIGFTMSIFITHLAFSDEGIIDAVKLGVFVASFIAATIGVWMLLRIDKNKAK
jgi:NhaA family Na+:H+ antiporter